MVLHLLQVEVHSESRLLRHPHVSILDQVIWQASHQVLPKRHIQCMVFQCDETGNSRRTVDIGGKGDRRAREMKNCGQPIPLG